MELQDSVLREHYERKVSLLSGFSVELRPVFALMDAYLFFGSAEGDQAPRVREAFYHLSDPDLLPALRQYFRVVSLGGETPAMIKFREKFSEIVGEPL